MFMLVGEIGEVGHLVYTRQFPLIRLHRRHNTTHRRHHRSRYVEGRDRRGGPYVYAGG